MTLLWDLQLDEVLPADSYRNIWATDALRRQKETDSLTLFVLSLSASCMSADFFLTFSPFPSVWPFFLFSPLSSEPFWHFVCVPNCLYRLSPSASLSSTCSLFLSLSASFHLFLYLSQWELMWPLCAVSSLRGRQSSSAPIRTALSGAVSTTGLPTHSLIQACHPPPTGWETEKKNRVTKMKRKGIWQRRCVSSPLLSLIHSLFPFLSSTIPH